MADIKELENAIEKAIKDNCEDCAEHNGTNRLEVNCDEQSCPHNIIIEALQEKLERENRISNVELLNRLDCIYNAKQIGYSDFLALRSIIEENDLHEQEQDKRQQGCEYCRNPRKQWTYLEKSDKYCKICGRDLRQSK